MLVLVESNYMQPARSAMMMQMMNPRAEAFCLHI